MAKIKDDALIRVKNNTAGGIAYENHMGILQRWGEPKAIRLIKFIDILQSLSNRGVYNMYSNGYLLIDQDNARDVMDELGLPELDDYVCSLDEIEDLLKGKDLEDLENVLTWGSKSQTETIVSIATNNIIKDANVTSIIKNVTGVDVTINYEDMKKDKSKSSKPARNSKKDEAEKPARPVRKSAVKEDTEKKSTAKTTKAKTKAKTTSKKETKTDDTKSKDTKSEKK